MFSIDYLKIEKTIITKYSLKRAKGRVKTTPGQIWTTVPLLTKLGILRFFRHPVYFFVCCQRFISHKSNFSILEIGLMRLAKSSKFGQIKWFLCSSFHNEKMSALVYFHYYQGSLKKQETPMSYVYVTVRLQNYT